jgi:hypothetical protein
MIAVLAKLIPYRYLIIAGLFLVLCVSFYLHYLKSTLVIAELRNKNTELSRIVTEQSKTIADLRVDYDLIIKGRDELAKEVSESKKELDKLKKTLYRENSGKKSLEKLSIKKTKLIERKIYQGTESLFKCLERISQGEVC